MQVSIIIATYNAGKVLQSCLDSIIPQLNADVELLIIDGLSKDNTMSIIKNNSRYISYYISEKDNGVYDAWNKGINSAKGEWIMFIGADDILLPHSIEKYLHFITENEVSEIDYISAKNEFVDNKGELLKIMGGASDWNKMKKYMISAHVASLHSKKNLFDKVGLYNTTEFKICSDYELLLRKQDNLKYLFFDELIARMQAGGMSFTLKAIVETYKIRKFHHSIGFLENQILFIRDFLGFKFFVWRKKLVGGKF